MEYYVIGTLLCAVGYAGVRLYFKRGAGIADFLGMLADLALFPVLAVWREYKARRR